MKVSLRPLLSAFAVCFLTLFISHQIYTSAMLDHYQQGQSIAEKRLKQVANALSQSMNLRLNLTSSLAAFVTTNRDFTQQEFDRYASLLQKNMAGVRSLQLAPNGVIRYLTNIENNRNVLNHNLLTDDRLSTVIQESIKNDSYTIHGPYNLRQGGFGIVARRPLFFIEPGKQKESFWGFATVVVETQPILKAAGFFKLEEDFILAIRGKNGLGTKGDIFYGSSSTFESPLAVTDVMLPNASWQLAAIQKPKTIPATFLSSLWYKVISVITALFLSATIYSTINQPQQLKKQVYLATESLRTTLNSIGDAVIATDTFGNITLMNPMAERLTGWNLSLALGKPMEEVFHIVHSKTRKAAISPVSIVLKQQEAVGIAEHTLLIAKDGTEYQITDSTSPIHDDDGNITGVVLVFRDITTNYAVHEALQKSESRFRNLFENSEISIWNEDMSDVYTALEQLRIDGVTDLRQHLKDHPQAAWNIAAKVKVIQVNQATMALFGAKNENEFFLQIEKTFGANAIEVFIDGLCAIWDKKHTFRSEATYRTLDGKDINTIISFYIPDTAEGFKSIPVNILNITDLKRAEEALRKSNIRFHKLFENTDSISVQGYDANRKAIYWNPASEKLYGYSSDEAIGQQLEDLIIPSKMREQTITDVTAWINEGIAISSSELTLRRADGSPVHIFSNHVLLQNQNNEQEMFCIDIDLTDLKQAKTALKSNEERYRELVDNMNEGVAVYEVIEDGQNFIMREHNRAGEQITGLLHDKVIGSRVTDVFPGMEALGLLNVFQRVWKTGKPEAYPAHQYQDNHITLWVENYVFKLPSGEIVAIYNDITERKQAEDELNAQITELRRWHQTTLGREGRVLELKREINTLLAELGHPPRYPSAIEDKKHHE